MAIRLGNSCANCENVTASKQCKVHLVSVDEGYTCDSFQMKAQLKNDPNCSTCARLETSSCAKPQKAAPGMLCAQWAPTGAEA